MVLEEQDVRANGGRQLSHQASAPFIIFPFSDRSAMTMQSRGEEAGRPLGPPANSLPPIDLSEDNKTEGYRSGRIEELMDTLECPVCLDTADTPPVYQCPEGHLICKDCNAKMVECPQCGHSLMNARNR